MTTPKTTSTRARKHPAKKPKPRQRKDGLVDKVPAGAKVVDVPGTPEKPEERPHWWFKPGNELWKLNPHPELMGKDRKFTPEQLREKIAGYFQWAKDNPIIEYKAFASQGEILYATIPKMRALTIRGLCVYIGVAEQTWNEWRRDKVYPAIQAWADSVIFEQKLSGAAAGVLNASIIARDLGLVDKVQTEQSGEVKYIVENAPDGMDE